MSVHITVDSTDKTYGLVVVVVKSESNSHMSFIVWLSEGELEELESQIKAAKKAMPKKLGD